MSPDMEARSIQNIESCRRLNHSLAAKVQEQGVTVEDIAIASIYAAYDLALIHNRGVPHVALGWMRKALDVMEASLPPSGSLQ